MKQKNLLIWALLVAISLGLLFFIKNQKQSNFPASRGEVVDTAYRNQVGSYEIRFPEEWFLKDITFDPRDEAPAKFNSAVLISDRPITSNRESMRLPSYGLLILSKPKGSQIISCPSVWGVSEPAGKVLIDGTWRERCLDIAGNNTFVIEFETETNMYTFLYPKDDMDEAVVNRIISSFATFR